MHLDWYSASAREVKPEKWKMKESQQRDNSSVVPEERLESMDTRSAEECSGAVVSYTDGQWDSVYVSSHSKELH